MWSNGHIHATMMNKQNTWTPASGKHIISYVRSPNSASGLIDNNRLRSLQTHMEENNITQTIEVEKRSPSNDDQRLSRTQDNGKQKANDYDDIGVDHVV